MQDQGNNKTQLVAGVLDSSLDGIMAFTSIRDGQDEIVDFTIEFVNRKCEEIVGRTSTQMLGQTMLEIFPGNKADGLFDAYVQVVQSGQPFCTEHFYDHDGLHHWLCIKAAKCGDGFTVTFSDITARKASEEHFRVLFERSTDAHLLFDETGVIDCNQAAVEMLRCDDKQDLLNIHPAELSPEFQPDGRRSMEKCIEMDQTARDKGYHRFDWMHCRKDGSDIPVEVTLNPVELSGKQALLAVWHDLTERVESERAVREAADRLNEAQELANIGNWQWTPADNVIIWSDQTKRMFGVPVDQPAPDFETHQKQIHPEDLAHWRSVVDQAMRDEKPYVMKFRTVLPDGEVRVILARGRCDHNADGQVQRMYGTTQDITEQEATRDRLETLSLVASRTDNSVVLMDSDEQITWVNRAFTTLSGYQLDEVAGKRPRDIFQGPDTETDTIYRIETKLSQGASFNETVLKYRKDGTTYWSDIEVQPIRDDRGEITNYMVVERDITQRIAQQRELEAQQHRLEFALHASRAGLWDWDISTGDNYLSDTWYTMLGYEPGELPMRVESWHAITMGEDLQRAQQALASYFAGEADRYACEIRVKNKAGDWQWVLDVGEAMERDEQGNVTRMIGLHLDIHEQKLAQIELEQARDQAQRASSAKSAFLANMSHEIRTPMNAILGFADLLLDGQQTESDKRNHAQIIRRNGKHLLNILNDVLDLSKIEAGMLSIEHVDCVPSELFEDIIDLMSTKASNRGVGLTLNMASEIPNRIKADPTRIQQVLLNLIGNAIKFTEHGEVGLSAELEPNDDGSATLRCTVTDTGIGIGDEQLDKLFKPFSQADESTTRKFGGTGLGLAISTNLCKMHGGELTCTSTPGVGSTFTATFRVQVAEETTRVDRPSNEPTHAATSNRLNSKRILIVEDGRDNQRLFNHYMTKAGASVVLANNGQEGKDAALAAEEANEPFDIVLMDMQMPVLDGYSATEQLRDAGCDLPIIALTAHASSEDRDNCLAAGCTDYLSKPVDRQHLIDTIAGYLNAGQQLGAGI